MDDLDLLYRKLEAVAGLYGSLALTAPLPPLGDYAIDPLFAVALVNVVLDVRPTIVLECGSGVSTVLTAAALRRHGIDGHVTSLEQDAVYADVTRGYLRRHGLDRLATVHTVDLVDHGVGRWYDTAPLDGLGPIDLLTIDGPSAREDPDARAAVLDVVHSRLRPGATLLVDDAMRPGEQRAFADWAERFPDVTFRYLLTQNGAALGTRAGQAPSP